ncbi:hypothetical protein Q7P36_002385 [Cladosporium allicinum]
MAGGFSFPPPPPPPPKPAVQSQPSEFDYASQQPARGGRGRGGFDAGGRGGAGAGRGRGGGQGNSNFEPLGNHQQRSTFGQGSGSAPSAEGRDVSSQRPASRGDSYSSSVNPRPPPGSHINPNFAGHRQDTRPNANYQPSERTSYSRGGGYGNRAPTNTRRDSNSHREPQDDGPGRTQAGHKRKLDALRGPQQPREKKPGPQTAPSVPSFGAPIFPSTTTPTPSQSAANPQRDQTIARPKPTSRTLGLTPKGGAEPDILSESEDEEIDEEAQFAELGTKLTFEHNGEVMTLNNEADLAAWRAERRKQFPTSHRVSQKESEMLQIGEERKRLLAAVSRLHQAPCNRKSEVKTRSLHEQSKGKEDATGSLQSDTRIQELPEQKRHVGVPRIEEIESQLEPSAVVNDELVAEDDPMDAQNDGEVAEVAPIISREQALSLLDPVQHTQKALPGIAMDDTDDESDAEADAAAPDVETETAPDGEAEAVPDVEAEPAHDSASDEDDGPPEQTSSKPRPSAASDAPKAVCRYFAASGRCRDGDMCRFRHELSSKAPSARPAQLQPERPAYDRYAPKLDPKTNDRKSIFERLVEQEEKGDDKLALQVIKALGQAGFFKEPATSE